MGPSLKIVHALTASAALFVAAWFALGAVQAHDVNAAMNAITATSPLTASQARHVDSLLDTAEVLNPDEQPDLLRSALYFDRGDRARAVAEARQVTRAEPQNAEAWLQLVHVSTGKVAAVALQRLAELAPAVPTSP